jgi:hypothetical protein
VIDFSESKKRLPRRRPTGPESDRLKLTEDWKKDVKGGAGDEAPEKGVT